MVLEINLITVVVGKGVGICKIKEFVLKKGWEKGGGGGFIESS